MNTNEFSQALLQSARIDAPETGAKPHALAQLNSAMQRGVGASAAVKTIALSKGTLILAASVAAAGTIGAGVAYQRRPASVALLPEIKKVDDVAREKASSPSSPSLSNQPTVHASATGSVAPIEVCAAGSVLSSGKPSVPGGHSVTFALKSQCTASTVDVFWVDWAGRESFRGMLRPGETFWQDSWDTHVFRVRDHMTHELVKEFLPAAVAGASDRAEHWRGAPTEVPLIVVHENDAPIADTPPIECGHGGGRAAHFRIRNERKDGPIALSEVDFACNEQAVQARLVEPGKEHDWHMSEGHAFRVRSATGALLLDVPPVGVDASRYLTVP